MYIETTCHHCDEEIDLEDQLFELTNSEQINVIHHLIEQNTSDELSVFIIPTNIQEELKLKQLHILYNNLSLEQLENIVKQFVSEK